jgi:hypothetical protein
LEVAPFLGNTELLEKFIQDDSPLDRSTVCSRLKKALLGRSADAEIEFAASHFYELDLEQLKGIDISILERIVSSQSLRLQKEESLLDFIFSLDEDPIVLLPYVRAEFLSAEAMNQLLETLSVWNLNPLIWDSTCRRLRLPVSAQRSESRFARQPLAKVEFPMQESRSRNRIITYLTKKHGGNVHELGIVAMSAAYPDTSKRVLKNLVNPASNQWYSSLNAPDQWVCWDFREMRVTPTHYTIKSFKLKSWVLEGSMDGENWTEIDRQKDTKDFKAGWATESFGVANPAEFRLIRLTQTDRNHHLDEGTDELILDIVEFFGTLSE